MNLFDLWEIAIKDLLALPSCFHRNRKLSAIRPIKYRKSVENDILYIGIHEWGGYKPMRRKHINKTIQDFDCGLEYQLKRFNNYNGTRHIDLTVTISDIEVYADIEKLKNCCHRLIPVSNIGMDFSGYSTFFKLIERQKNSYVLLTNSSVNAHQVDFIDSYLDYLEKNPDVGMLGISCCSKCYQTLIRHNFTPHLQSFFLLTTIDVLNEAIKLNGGKFPGSGISNKQLLIREGEIKLSQLVLQLGYKLAVVTQKGPVKFDNNPKNWILPWGDYRCYTSAPNAINPIK